MIGKRLKVGDHLRRKSESGQMMGRILAMHARDDDRKGHIRRASPEEHQYEIKSDKTDHVATHKGCALMTTR